MGKLKESLNYMIYGGIAIGVASLEGLINMITVLSSSTGMAIAAVIISGLGGVVLAAVTIYLCYLRCELVYNVNMACGLKENGDTSNRSMNFVLVELLTRITLGIYGMYWIYKQEQRMLKVGKRYGVTNQLKTKEKYYFYMIVAGVGCTILAALFVLIGAIASIGDMGSSLLSLGSSYLGYSYPTFTGAKVCSIFSTLFSIASVVLSVLGRNPLYHDVNILSAAFNRETNNGNQIVCVGGRPGPGPIPGDIPLPGPGATGGVRVLSGQYAGSVIQMQNKERITIGRDKSQCDLVCNSDRVSRVHLSITYFASGMSGPEYIVRDMSSNGTNSSTIGQLPKNQEVRQRPGSVLTLGNSAESVQLL